MVLLVALFEAFYVIDTLIDTEVSRCEEKTRVLECKIVSCVTVKKLTSL